MSDSLQPEFSFRVDVTSLPTSGRRYEIKADESERARVAERLGLIDIKSLTAAFDIVPRADGILAVTGLVKGSLTQTCVVTLTPVPATLREDVDARFTMRGPGKASPKASGRAGGKFEKDVEELVSFTDEEPPEEAMGGHIDLGELAVVHLALGLDPYPRARGATFGNLSLGKKGEKIEVASPFVVLARLKPKTPPGRAN